MPETLERENKNPTNTEAPDTVILDPEAPSEQGEVYSDAEVDKSLKQALDLVRTNAQDPEFHQQCENNGISPFEDTTTGYWHQMLSYTGKTTREAWEIGDIDDLDYYSRKVMFATPLYVMEQAKLNQGEVTGQERAEAIKYSDTFKGLVADMVETFPEVTTGTIEDNLENMINETIEDDGLVQAGSQYVNSVIRGVKHELAFGQILKASGMEFQKASPEDKRRGVDYKINREDGAGVDVSVHPTVSKFQREGMGDPDELYAWKPDGTLMMHSLISEEEFGGKFFIDTKTDNNLTQQRAGYIREAIESDLKHAV